MVLFELFRFSPAPYVHACQSPRAPWFVSLFIFLTGVLYGLLLALFQREVGGEMAGVPIAEIPLYILVLGNIAGGIAVVVVAHVGITLIAWLMAKAIGGPGLMIGIYRTTAYLLPFTWLILPAIAKMTVFENQPAAAGGVGPGLVAAALLGAGLFLFGLFQIYLLTQERGPRRAGMAVVLFVLFMGSVLYLAGA